ncbi:uncharacterized protein [Prorops nasuta]|uniref:uncharacterized protein n=1 Tax=Prorops nasuta TaxID=863751 RepID=UPI0034CFDF94
MIERWHRTVKTALMCNPQICWMELLPRVLLGLRTALKEDINATCAELVYGTTLRLPGEFFINQELPMEPQIFLEKFRLHMRGLRPTPTAHHSKTKIFLLKGLKDCTHIFLRNDAVKKPLEPPFSGPFKVIKRLDDTRMVIDAEGEVKTISIDRVKPAFIIKEEDDTSQASTPSSHQWGSTMDPPKKTYGKSVSFR